MSKNSKVLDKFETVEDLYNCNEDISAVELPSGWFFIANEGFHETQVCGPYSSKGACINHWKLFWRTDPKNIV